MDIELYNTYVRHLDRGRKKDAKQAVLLFVNSFTSLNEMREWSYAYLPKRETNHASRIRHELYEHIIFPVLLDGFNDGDPLSFYWLAATAQNLMGSSKLHKQIGYISPDELFKSAYESEPNSPRFQHGLLSSLVAGFCYMDHEWPSGIILGLGENILEAVDEIENDIELALELDHSKEYTQRINLFKSRVAEYVERIETLQQKTT